MKRFALLLIGLVASMASSGDLDPELRCTPSEVAGTETHGECAVEWEKKFDEPRWKFCSRGEDCGEADVVDHKHAVFKTATGEIVKVHAYIWDGEKLHRLEIDVCWDGERIMHRTGSRVFSIDMKRMVKVFSQYNDGKLRVVSEYSGACTSFRTTDSGDG